MEEKLLTKKHLPTGEEPPKGYETLIKEEPDTGETTVQFVMYSHLARSERALIEALRNKSLEQVSQYTGLTNEPLSIEREVRIIEAVEDFNKMFALAYFEKRLVGYALVAIGWPKACQWLIQHMIIDPDMRQRGVGTALVKNIERCALESEVTADSICAVPIQESGRKVWQDNGYTGEAARFLMPVAGDVDHEIIVYHKAL
jgi:GNAT superfamily N-acetyltransferase